MPFCTTLVLGIHLVSTHFGGVDPDQYKTYTPGIYAQCDSWAAGVYHNSYGNTSAYVAQVWDVWGPLQVVAGGVVGYGHGIKPALIPTVHWNHYRVTLVPTIGKGTSNALSFSVETQF